MTSRYSINKRGGKRQTSSKQTQAIIQIKENSVMSYLFTAVSAEQQEMVAGGRRGRRPSIVVAPKIATVTQLNINGTFQNVDRNGRNRNKTEQDNYSSINF
jgi:hypothetical protein